MVMALRTSFLFYDPMMHVKMSPDYIVQGHRFNILEDIGCVPEIYNTPPAYPLVFMWPVLLGCISFVYAGMFPVFFTELFFLTQLQGSRYAPSGSVALHLTRSWRPLAI